MNSAIDLSICVVINKTKISNLEDGCLYTHVLQHIPLEGLCSSMVLMIKNDRLLCSRLIMLAFSTSTACAREISHTSIFDAAYDAVESGAML